MAFYDPFAQYGSGIQQAQDWSAGQQAALPPQSPPYGTAPIPISTGRPFIDALNNMFSGIRQRRQFRQLARQGINPFTMQPGSTINAQPEAERPAYLARGGPLMQAVASGQFTGDQTTNTAAPASQTLPRTAAPASGQSMNYGMMDPYASLFGMYGSPGMPGSMYGPDPYGWTGGYGGYGFAQPSLGSMWLQQLASSPMLYGNRWPQRSVRAGNVVTK